MTLPDKVVLILTLPVFSIVSTGVASLIIDGDLYPLTPLTFGLGCFAAACFVTYMFARFPISRGKD